MLYIVARRILGDSERADEVVNLCLDIASQHWVTFDTDGAFYSWLLRLAIDQAILELNRKCEGGITCVRRAQLVPAHQAHSARSEEF
jgi:DNA-directed RNA polymerase specialized sigma24 family protein